MNERLIKNKQFHEFLLILPFVMKDYKYPIISRLAMSLKCPLFSGKSESDDLINFALAQKKGVFYAKASIFEVEHYF